MKCVTEYKCTTEIIAWIGMKVSTLVIFIVLSLETYSFHIYLIEIMLAFLFFNQ